MRSMACVKSGIRACDTHLLHLAKTKFAPTGFDFLGHFLARFLARSLAPFFGTMFGALFGALSGAIFGAVGDRVVFQVREVRLLKLLYMLTCA